jgi:hypothetical protein
MPIELAAALRVLMRGLVVDYGVPIAVPALAVNAIEETDERLVPVAREVTALD